MGFLNGAKKDPLMAAVQEVISKNWHLNPKSENLTLTQVATRDKVQRTIYPRSWYNPINYTEARTHSDRSQFVIRSEITDIS